MARIVTILGVVAGFLATPAAAYDRDYPPDMVIEAAQCAAYWFADQNLQETKVEDEDYDGYSAGIASIFKAAAVDLAEGEEARVDYLIRLNFGKFTMLITDANTSDLAQELSIRVQQKCNGVGLDLGPKWGLH